MAAGSAVELAVTLEGTLQGHRMHLDCGGHKGFHLQRNCQANTKTLGHNGHTAKPPS